MELKKIIESEINVDSLKDNPEIVDELIEKANEIKKYHSNPLYVDARRMYEDTQKRQINKGLEKYPEPLNADSWSIDDLVQHAFDELVDQSHYIIALKFKSDRMKKELKSALHMVNQAAEQIKNYYSELEHWRERAIKAENELREGPKNG